ncbi:MAG: response regulator transcription factor [Oscillospiraceae bacterium]|nr:response regulator transcription factor [Oscillospiraceae bacterium]
MRVLIVEDEERMALTIQQLLSTQRMLSDIASDGEAGLDSAMSGIYDLIILDVMLPKLDGLEVVRRLRAKGRQIPVLLLTARGEVPDRVRGLNAGADYYLTKPFASSELLACVRALLRRPEELRPDTLVYGDLTLSVETGILSCGTERIQLSKKELELMRLLMGSGGAPVERETLLLKAWGYDNMPESNVLDAYMSFLRKKLQHLQSNVEVTSRRQIGYCLREKNA